MNHIWSKSRLLLPLLPLLALACRSIPTNSSLELSQSALREIFPKPYRVPLLLRENIHVVSILDMDDDYSLMFNQGYCFPGRFQQSNIRDDSAQIPQTNRLFKLHAKVSDIPAHSKAIAALKGDASLARSLSAQIESARLQEYAKDELGPYSDECEGIFKKTYSRRKVPSTDTYEGICLVRSVVYANKVRLTALEKSVIDAAVLKIGGTVERADDLSLVVDSNVVLALKCSEPKSPQSEMVYPDTARRWAWKNPFRSIGSAFASVWRAIFHSDSQDGRHIYPNDIPRVKS